MIRRIVAASAVDHADADSATAPSDSGTTSGLRSNRPSENLSSGGVIIVVAMTIEHDRGVGAVVHGAPPADPELPADRGEDQSHLAARDHADPHAQPVEPLLEHAQGADLLAQDGGQDEHRGQAQDPGVGEAPEVDLDAHHHEEDRHQEIGQGADQLLELVPPAALSELAILHLLEDQPRGEGADDRRQAHLRGEPREAEADRQGRDREHPTPLEVAGGLEDGPAHELAEEKRHRTETRTPWRRSRGGWRSRETRPVPPPARQARG